MLCKNYWVIVVAAIFLLLGRNLWLILMVNSSASTRRHKPIEDQEVTRFSEMGYEQPRTMKVPVKFFKDLMKKMDYIADVQRDRKSVV